MRAVELLLRGRGVQFASAKLSVRPRRAAEFLVPADLTVGQLCYVIRKRVKARCPSGAGRVTCCMDENRIR